MGRAEKLDDSGAVLSVFSPAEGDTGVRPGIVASCTGGGDGPLRRGMFVASVGVQSSVASERQLGRQPSAATGSALDRE
jgi:hypothetical protein